MRLVNTRLGMEIELYENQVLNLTIETPERFAEVVYNVSKQVEGEEGDFILSDIEKELSLERKAIMVSNPLMVNCNGKKFYPNFIRICQRQSQKITQKNLQA